MGWKMKTEIIKAKNAARPPSPSKSTSLESDECFCWFYMWILLEEEAFGKSRSKWIFLVKQKLHRMFDFTLTTALTGHIPSLASFCTWGRSKETSQECIAAMRRTEARCFGSRICVPHWYHMSITGEGKTKGLWNLVLTVTELNSMFWKGTQPLFDFHIWQSGSAPQNIPRPISEQDRLQVIGGDRAKV